MVLVVLYHTYFHLSCFKCTHCHHVTGHFSDKNKRAQCKWNIKYHSTEVNRANYTMLHFLKFKSRGRLWPEQSAKMSSALPPKGFFLQIWQPQNVLTLETGISYIFKNKQTPHTQNWLMCKISRTKVLESMKKRMRWQTFRKHWQK